MKKAPVAIFTVIFAIAVAICVHFAPRALEELPAGLALLFGAIVAVSTFIVLAGLVRGHAAEGDKIAVSKRSILFWMIGEKTCVAWWYVNVVVGFFSILIGLVVCLVTIFVQVARQEESPSAAAAFLGMVCMMVIGISLVYGFAVFKLNPLILEYDYLTTKERVKLSVWAAIYLLAVLPGAGYLAQFLFLAEFAREASFTGNLGLDLLLAHL